MRVHFIYSDKDGEQEDYTELNSLRGAEEQLKGIVQQYNKVEKQRYGDTAVLRKFVRITATDGEGYN